MNARTTKESVKASQAKSSSAAARMPLLDKAAGRARKRESLGENSWRATTKHEHTNTHLARDRPTTLQEADGMRSSEDDLSPLEEELTDN